MTPHGERIRLWGFGRSEFRYLVPYRLRVVGMMGFILGTEVSHVKLIGSEVRIA